MKVIGLAGGSGSGKGEVSKIFLKLGIPSIDADAVYHKITSKKSSCLDALTFEFGKTIIKSDGGLDRRKLSEIVFQSENSESKRMILNQISHKFVLKEIRDILCEYEKNGESAVIVDAPLLFESGFDKECDLIISVIAPIETRVRRIVSRDKITEDKALARINAQLSNEELSKRSNYLIFNNGDLVNLENEIQKIYLHIKE